MCGEKWTVVSFGMQSYLLERIHPVLHSSAFTLQNLLCCIVVLFTGRLPVPRNSLEKSTTPLPSIICILALRRNSILFWEHPEQETLLGRSYMDKKREFQDGEDDICKDLHVACTFPGMENNQHPSAGLVGFQ